MGIGTLTAVRLDETAPALVILDQTLLPGEVKYLALTTPEAVWEAIRKLRVRGAPAIGIAAALGLYVCMRHTSAGTAADFSKTFYKTCDYLASARPTAVNLFWALERMRQTFEANRTQPLPDILAALRNTAAAIRDEDERTCRAIGEYGAGLLSPGDGVLTHCNAGLLAASKYGTALAPIYVCQERGVPLRVYADETRPLLQGARLTAFELRAAGADVTLLCDNMAASVMRQGLINAVFVGCDRVAANGDFANKIGTLGVAVLAAAYGIPFYVCAPYSTIDPDTPAGVHIEIEQRDPSEVTDLWYARPVAPAGVKVLNPAFDMTEARYVTAFITERGIVRPPFVF